MTRMAGLCAMQSMASTFAMQRMAGIVAMQGMSGMLGMARMRDVLARRRMAGMTGMASMCAFSDRRLQSLLQRQLRAPLADRRADEQHGNGEYAQPAAQSAHSASPHTHLHLRTPGILPQAGACTIVAQGRRGGT